MVHCLPDFGQVTSTCLPHGGRADLIRATIIAGENFEGCDPDLDLDLCEYFLSEDPGDRELSQTVWFPMLLPPHELELFFRLPRTLMFFVNQSLRVIPDRIADPDAFPRMTPRLTPRSWRSEMPAPV